jgi:hypothetical protein
MREGDGGGKEAMEEERGRGRRRQRIEGGEKGKKQWRRCKEAMHDRTKEDERRNEGEQDERGEDSSIRQVEQYTKERRRRRNHNQKREPCKLVA